MLNKISKVAAALGLYTTELTAASEQESSRHLTVHLCPHSHDDVGWLKTVDQYFTGSAQDIQHAEVQVIIDNVIEQLIQDPKKRFTQVEMKFFSMWWDRQTSEMKDAVRGLVEEGRLDFVNAGWSMHDEACTHHDDMINNMMLGHEFLEREFGFTPSIGWHIDPFGHSNANPRLFAEMGMDAWFFARIDFQDKKKRLQERSMEWVWKPFSESLGDSVAIFSHTMRDGYSYPFGFRYDPNWYANQPVVADETLETFNADVKAREMWLYVKTMAEQYRGSHLFIPWGDDFAFSNARLTFHPLDELIPYFNEHFSDITLMYSTPSQYIESIKKENIEWPVRYDDMFPYADKPNDYWTGYYSSRANKKQEDRIASANLHASSKIFAQKVISQVTPEDVIEQILGAKQTMLDALGIMQHHDAITGTARQAVADNYSKHIEKAMAKSNEVLTAFIGEKAYLDAGLPSDGWRACEVVNGRKTSCKDSNADIKDGVTLVSLYNPSTIEQSSVRLMVGAGSQYMVEEFDPSDSSWRSATSDLLCYEAVRDDPRATIFTACDLHAAVKVQTQAFAYLRITKSEPESDESSNQPTSEEPLTISQEWAQLSYIKTSEDQVSYFDFESIDGTQARLGFSLKRYHPANGTDDFPEGDKTPDASGAYLFKPIKGDMDKHPYSKFKSVKTFSGDLVSAIILQYASEDNSEIYTAIVRLAKGSGLIEFEVQMHGIPISDGLGKEIVANWEIDGFQNDGVFYTDSNGLEMQRRELDQRPGWTLETKEKQSSNYYPIQQAIAIRDKDMQVTVMNDRSQGGSVLSAGSIELMQDRRLLFDDSRGLNQPLNEINELGVGIKVNAQYYVQIFDRTKTRSLQRQQQLVTDEPLLAFYQEAQKYEDVSPSKKSDLSPVFFSDVKNLKIHLFPEARNQILVRLENMSDLFDGKSESTPYFELNAYLEELFARSNQGMRPSHISITERTLSNNQDMVQWRERKFHWPTEVGDSPVAYPADRAGAVAIQPQRIRLFRVVYQADQQATFLQ